MNNYKNMNNETKEIKEKTIGKKILTIVITVIIILIVLFCIIFAFVLIKNHL